MGRKSILAALIALIVSAYGQTTRGSIARTTVARSNAAVPDAPVIPDRSAKGEAWPRPGNRERSDSDVLHTSAQNAQREAREHGSNIRNTLGR